MNPILQGWTPPARPTSPRPPGAGVTRLSLVGEITLASATPMFRQIEAAAARGDSIAITIDSAGGNALCALALFELLALHPCRVVATIQRASSGALLTALGADIRRVSPGARLMVHETCADLSNASADTLREALADLQQFNTLATAIIAAACGRTVDEVTQWRGTSARFSARQAVAAGLAHEITHHRATASASPVA